MKNYKKIFIKLSLVFFLSQFMLSCEADSDRLGEQLFSKVDWEDVSYDLVAYNIDNKDTIRADYQELGYGVLGAFSENVFGGQKASYISQVRLNSYAPNFGTNPVIDSAVLVLKPLYDTSTLVEKTEDYTYPDGNVEATKTVKTYSVYTYGKSSLPVGGFTINVQEVTDYLGAVAERSFSNRIVAVNSTILGTKKFEGKVSQVNINKKEDNSSLFAKDASFRVELDKDFFQQKIIGASSENLSDAAHFVRYFRGLKVSVAENDGYLFRFDPNSTQILVYYKSGDVDNRVSSTLTMSLGSGNVHIGQYEYSRTDSDWATALASLNSTTGDSKLFLQGMGGPSVGIRIPATVISELKEKFNKDKVAILGAKIRLYVDNLWKNNYTKPSTFVFLEKEGTAFLPEMTTFSAVTNYSMIKMQDASSQNPYYDIVVTQTLKDRIEKEAESKDFILHMGDWRLSGTNSQTYYGYKYDSRAYAPERMVFVGTDANNDKRIKLHITYAK